jgi:hypothetical protein
MSCDFIITQFDFLIMQLRTEKTIGSNYIYLLAFPRGENIGGEALVGRSFRTLLNLFAAGGAAVSISSAAQATLVYDTSLASPGFYNGSGNPNEGFTVNTVGGIELGLGVNNRFVGPVHPTSGNVYDVAVGFSTVPLAKWNFEYSVNLGNSGLTLGRVNTRLTITNLLNSQVFSFDPFTVSDNAHFDGTTTHNSGGALPTDIGFQNSENLSFFPLGPAFGWDPTAGGSYLITLALVNEAGAPILSVDEQINATPIPATLPLFATGLGALGLLARRRKRKQSA